MRKWRCREVKLLVQGCRAGKQQSWNSNPAFWPQTSRPYNWLFSWWSGKYYPLPILPWPGRTMSGPLFLRETVFAGLALWIIPQGKVIESAEVIIQVLEACGHFHLGLLRHVGSLGGRKGCSRASGTVCIFQGGLFRFCYYIHLFLENYYSQLSTQGLLFVSCILSGLFKCTAYRLCRCS